MVRLASLSFFLHATVRAKRSLDVPDRHRKGDLPDLTVLLTLSLDGLSDSFDRDL